jgi:hypothetical protein
VKLRLGEFGFGDVKTIRRLDSDTTTRLDPCWAGCFMYLIVQERRADTEELLTRKPAPATGEHLEVVLLRYNSPGYTNNLTPLQPFSRHLNTVRYHTQREEIKEKLQPPRFSTHRPLFKLSSATLGVVLVQTKGFPPINSLHGLASLGMPSGLGSFRAMHSLNSMAVFASIMSGTPKSTAFRLIR